MKKIRIGSGAGYAGDRIEPAIDIIKKGNLDYIIFECLAERTIALAQQQKLLDPTKGYNELLEYRMEKILPLCIEKKVKIITNMGAANPLAAVKSTKRLAELMEIKHLKIAAVLGDDVYHTIEKYMDYTVIETGEKLRSIIGYKDGYICEGEISYGGPGALERAKLAGEIIKRRLENGGPPIDELRIDFIGVNSLYQDTLSEILNDGKQDFKEVRLRVAARTQIREAAFQIGNEVEALYTNGPAGGGGARKFSREIIAIGSILIPETDIKLEVVYEEVKL